MSAPAGFVTAPREASTVSLSRSLYADSSESISDSNDGRWSRGAPKGARKLDTAAVVEE
ncbi:hypothetical protein TRAPUB_6940 [Trametes pubescens]|uniref:Uncharacterized protein n=1 Tax=Trametes pubescens TaxID=154538 RepID=A0A1M2V4P1_TRAPU|nr:hypothetical protein TRAPUB_6940 [Trametes pubescens]